MIIYYNYNKFILTRIIHVCRKPLLSTLKSGEITHLKHGKISPETFWKHGTSNNRQMLTLASRVNGWLWLSGVQSENLIHPSGGEAFSPLVLQQRYDEARRPRRKPVSRRSIRPAMGVPGRVVTPEQPTEYTGHSDPLYGAPMVSSLTRQFCSQGHW